jgi:hypothetical protein
MKITIFLTILLLLCLVSCGCTQAPAPAAPSATVAPVQTLSLSSDNPNATFAHEPGVIVVSFQADSAQKMELDFSNLSQGYGEATELSTTGPYAGSVSFQVPARDTYNLNVTSTGRWTAAVAPLQIANPLKAPVNLSGTGTQVTPVFYLERGEYIFERNVTGLDSPYYFLGYSNGTPLMDTSNTYIQPAFGALSPHPFMFITIPENGTYYLNVLGRNNPGGWSVSISPAPQLPPMGPGPVIPPLTK